MGFSIINHPAIGVPPMTSETPDISLVFATHGNLGDLFAVPGSWQVNFMLVNLGSLDDAKKPPGEISLTSPAGPVNLLPNRL